MRWPSTATLFFLALVAAGPRSAAAEYILNTLASFNGSNGLVPIGSLVRDSQGSLFGTTVGGGAFNVGTVFELAAGSSTITTLASFNGTNGNFVTPGLVLDAQGNLFGTAELGGTPGDGTVWELAAGSNTLTTLASFNGTNGANPMAGVILDAHGNLFGTTSGGGAADRGTVFELAAGSSTITTLASFNGANGNAPRGNLVQDAQGNLFGTTYFGGAADLGTVWELAAGSSTITSLASFNGINGGGPASGLVRDAQSNLFGTTAFGGVGDLGTVFELAAGSSTITTLASSNAARPNGTLVQDAQGNLFGTTYFGGAGDLGTVFELAAGSSTLTTLASFNGTNGAHPMAGVILDAQSNLFGTTGFGGLGDFGTVFELSPVPEPGSLVLLCLGLASLAAWATRARNAVREQRNKRAY